MAQLHVQKKRNRLWWLWIIVLLIAIAAIYYLLVQNNTIPDTFGLKRISAFVPRNNNLIIA